MAVLSEESAAASLLLFSVHDLFIDNHIAMFVGGANGDRTGRLVVVLVMYFHMVSDRAPVGFEMTTHLAFQFAHARMVGPIGQGDDIARIASAPTQGVGYQMASLLVAAL